MGDDHPHQIVLDGRNGRSLSLGRTTRGDTAAFWSYVATLRLPSAEATTVVFDHGASLAGFFRGLRDDRDGTGGVREYESHDGQMYWACSYDGHDTIGCLVALRQPWPPEWTLEGTLEFGATEHVEKLAADVDAFVAGRA